ncbi:unnamed protein product [Trichobilharzia regenti]|nr:unnamed protein product [Trichobilharzia regenti]
MEKVKALLTKALGEKATDDFIKACMEVDDTQIIKKRVATLLDTRKPENRQVYEILIREKIRRSGFTGEVSINLHFSRFAYIQNHDYTSTKVT